ncbi:cadmium-translocating P-type ATPase [Halobacillus salinarum]|uniref:Cadmium-translocating P-type ATPase n=1 Tax=Halobacillus salinarum TaxID=2932257 RepID=A0ABY4EJP8_9BACI|nr:heavy metal translocating P-type ATPase [Halobacillus salinarum]UOQ43844.1 cadmium-translocating P-type ATPase [Halobacillus salinarum]
MTSETRSIQALTPSAGSNSPSRFSSVKEHGELAGALFSGLLILIAWLGEPYLPISFKVFLYVCAYVIGGFAKAKEGLEETLHERELNVELLMILAAVGSASIGYWTEGAVLIFIFALSGAMETYTLNKSQKEIGSLMKLQPEEALLITRAGYEQVPVKKLEIGNQILIKAGERVPSDGRVVKGQSSVDESTITGESVPVSKELSQEVYAGTVNISGSLIVEITKTTDHTLFQKIIKMVQSAQNEKSPSQLFIERFESNYVKIVLSVVALMLFLPHFLLGWSWMDTFYRAMILLVVASPCALVASIMPAALSAISNGARNGVLYKGGVHLENLAHINAIAFDKTGTLTNGKPKVTDFLVDPDADENELLAVTAAIEQESNHPLAQAIVLYAADKNLPELTIENMQDVSGQGVTASIQGVQWKIGKGDFVGNEQSRNFMGGAAQGLASEGKTIVFIERGGIIAGLIALKDTVRKETKQAIETLKSRGIYTVMLTGDNETTAKAIAEEAGLNHYIAECMPDEKVKEVKRLKHHFQQVAMVGDGINDAPALAAANVGIAMGEGTDVALETADVVLMKNDLPKITKAIQLSTRMNKIVKQNVVFSIGMIMLLIISNFLQALDLPLGVIGHEGSTILVILNGLRLLK